MELPGWAVDRARAALNIGLKVPEVEQQLIAKGLTAAEANEVVMSVLEGHVSSALAPLEAEDKWRPLQLVGSLVVAAICLGLVYYFGGPEPAVWTLVCILPGLACIWLSEIMAGKGLCVFGWLYLLLVGGGRVVLVAIFNRPG